MVQPSPEPQAGGGTRVRVVFLCYGNACRSQMAESFAARDAATWIDPTSAGVSPLGYIPAEVEMVMQEIGCDVEGQWSKSLSEAQQASAADVIVDLAGLLSEDLPGQHVISQPVVDPFGGDLDDYRRTREAVAEVLPGIYAQIRERFVDPAE